MEYLNSHCGHSLLSCRWEIKVFGLVDMAVHPDFCYGTVAPSFLLSQYCFSHQCSMSWHLPSWNLTRFRCVAGLMERSGAEPQLNHQPDCRRTFTLLVRLPVGCLASLLHGWHSVICCLALACFCRSSTTMVNRLLGQFTDRLADKLTDR